MRRAGDVDHAELREQRRRALRVGRVAVEAAADVEAEGLFEREAAEIARMSRTPDGPDTLGASGP